MNKLRTDSVFNQLTPEQTELLEDWLFEEKLGYKETLERMEKEFGVKGSQSGMSRYYQRLAKERTEEGLVEMMGACVSATKTAEHSGALQAGLLTLAYKCAVQFLIKSPEKIMECPALLRALVSVQTLEMKRVGFQREEERIRQAKLERERKEDAARQAAWQWAMEQEELSERRKEKRLAKLAAKAAEQGKGEINRGDAETQRGKENLTGGNCANGEEVKVEAEPGASNGKEGNYADNGMVEKAVIPLNPV